MGKISVTWWHVPLMGLLYLAMVFTSCFIGFLNPVCWAYFSVLAALVCAFPYLWLAARWHRFGLGTALSLLVCLFCLATGEASGWLSKAIILGCGVLSDIVRLILANNTRKGVYAAYPILAIGNIGWVIRLWTEPEWYYQGAINEMGEQYAKDILKLQTTGHLISVIILTAVAAVLAIWLMMKANKRSARLLKKQ